MTTKNNDSLKIAIPQRDAKNAVHAVTKRVICLIPRAGGSPVELTSYLVTPPPEKRRDESFQKPVEGQQTLEKQVEGLKVEVVFQREEFVEFHALRRNDNIQPSQLESDIPG